MKVFMFVILGSRTFSEFSTTCSRVFLDREFASLTEQYCFFREMEELSLSEFQFSMFGYDQIETTLYDECAQLFSQHYGVWGNHSHKQGQRVILSSSRLKDQHIFNKSCGVCIAKKGNQLIGHAFYCRFPFQQGMCSY